MKVTGIVLAGGLGRRMDGQDKGLALLRGQPMVTHVIERLQPQADELLINANRELMTYAGFGFPVVSDTIPGFAGPLAGLHCGMQRASHPLVAMVPCDAPRLPVDLVKRLKAALLESDAQVAVATADGWMQPTFSLCQTALLHELNRFIEGGGRKVNAWYATLKCTEVPFDDQSDAFININTLEELACMNR